jgi:hypothetical protein
MRHFCGFCGTPLSFWSEEPRDEADFIHLALGSLSPRSLADLEAEWEADLEDLGFLPALGNKEDENHEQSTGREVRVGNENRGEKRTKETVVARLQGTISARVAQAEMSDVPSGLDTHDGAVRLGTFRTSMSWGSNRSGAVRVEWEVVEWSDDEATENPLKRKLDEVEGAAGVGDLQGAER